LSPSNIQKAEREGERREREGEKERRRREEEGKEEGGRRKKHLLEFRKVLFL
jgi:hypothetical protein